MQLVLFKIPAHTENEISTIMNVSRYLPSILGEKIGTNKIVVINNSAKKIQIDPEINLPSKVSGLTGPNPFLLS
ncbi:hypothetical protein [Mycoplasmopsis cynos]|uniref:hypothetical protein n=1 Tax=Mycoplasmopsis cynos TaxID=171284 RepID=UPI0024C7E315|nr:hypothetical protein [Mycoplasmopsis cynos]WAM04187.1 hypothetical protein ONA01_03830 [Mycoplasmopsis cynos]